MKKNILFIALIAIAFTSCVQEKVAAPSSGSVSTAGLTLIHYWSFNDDVDTVHMLTPDTTIGGGSITFSLGTGGYVDSVTPGSGLNLRMGRDTGVGMRVRCPFNSWVLHIPTTNYKNPIVQFVVENSTSGPTSNSLTYSTDNGNKTWTPVPGSNMNLTFSGTWTVYAIDFSSISAASNCPYFAITITNPNPTSTTGNDRFDNITVDALPN